MLRNSKSVAKSQMIDKPDAMKKIIDSTVANSDVHSDYDDLKDLTMELLQAEKKRLKKPKNDNVVSVEKQSLLVIFDKSVKDKQHPYDGFKKYGFIKDPLVEFLKVK
jgi:hypothetical protein